jgi:hypothetical protein
MEIEKNDDRSGSRVNTEREESQSLKGSRAPGDEKDKEVEGAEGVEDEGEGATRHGPVGVVHWSCGPGSAFVGRLHGQPLRPATPIKRSCVA